MRQSEILKARPQVGDLGRDERTSENDTEVRECGLDLSQQLSASHKNSFVESVSCMCSVVGWFVINKLKGMWKEAVVKLTLALQHYTKSFLNTVSRIFNKCLAEHWLDSPS